MVGPIPSAASSSASGGGAAAVDWLRFVKKTLIFRGYWILQLQVEVIAVAISIAELAPNQVMPDK